MSLKTPSKLEKIFSEGHYGVTSECGPPRGTNIDHVTKKAELIKDHVDAINITDNQTSMTRLCSLAACIRLKLMGLEPVLQMVTRDRNRIALQSDILGAASFDINNILCLSGDHNSFGDCPQGQNVHDIDSMQLAQMVRAIIVTRGGEGSEIITKKKSFFIPAAPVKAVVDPTGCGDAYRAGLLYGLMKGMDWETTGRIAALMGAIKIEQAGTQNHIATPEEIGHLFEKAFDYRFE